MYNEDDLLPVSALQHLAFCERQCALIHIEQLWVENRFTAEGRVMHEKAHDEDKVEIRDGVRTERGMSLRSLRLGLIGKADVIEFHRSSDKKTGMPFPVEYKRGKPKGNDCDKVQLCAQAMCLEEMMNVAIPCGALYYGKTHHRLDVDFDVALRQVTEDTTCRLHAFIDARHTPPAVYMKKCEACSLMGVCLPKMTPQQDQVAVYMREFLYG